MLYQEQFQSISKFLKEWRWLHEKEFVKKYPAPYPELIANWVKELAVWENEKIARFESNPHEDMVDDKVLKTYVRRIRELSALDGSNLDPAPLSEKLLRKIKKKKAHELSLVKSLFANGDDYKQILDIGGGAGYLSCALLEEGALTSICLDMNEQVQASGAKFCSNFLGENSDKISFENARFSRSIKIKALEPEKAIALSLHGCGALSSNVIEFGADQKLKGLVNFGCCYHKLDGAYNLSELSHSCGMEFSTNAFHLASRCAKIVCSNEIASRKKFKRYRYTLHYFLNDRYGLEFKPLGNAKKSDYEGAFSDYFKKFAPQYIVDEVSEKEIEAFFSDPKTTQKFNEHFAADLIRLLLGRLIELYIVLDRAIYLQEQGRDAHVLEVFDRELSPRNIMLKSDRLA